MSLTLNMTRDDLRGMAADAHGAATALEAVDRANAAANLADAWYRPATEAARRVADSLADLASQIADTETAFSPRSQLAQVLMAGDRFETSFRPELIQWETVVYDIDGRMMAQYYGPSEDDSVMSAVEGERGLEAR